MRLACLAAWALLLASSAQAQLRSSRVYVALNQPLTVTLAAPESSSGALSVLLIDPRTGATVDRASAPRGEIDLASLFPSLWTSTTPRVLLAQAQAGDAQLGPPLVLEPLFQHDPLRDELTREALDAIRRRDTEALARLGALSDAERARLHSTPANESPEAVFCGVRLYEDRLVLLDTSAGPLTLALRPEFAPNTAFAFRSLVEGGLYDGTIVHRVVSADALGRPFLIQAGDPTGVGLGGPGFQVGFEPSALPHDLGVVSLARRPTELGSGGSQFFICLSREACAGLDGRYASFAQVVEGLDTLDTIAAVPTGPIDPDNPASAYERPLDPPVIKRATTVPAPPFAERAPPIKRTVPTGVER